MLTAARWPTVIFGVLGCLAVYGLGAMAYNRWVGLLAALFLAFNPLYRMHARRAMSDVIAESLILLTALGFLWTWRRLLAGRFGPATWLAAGAAGVAGGLAPLAKLNGALGMIIVVAWGGFACVLPQLALRRKLAVAVAVTGTGIVALGTFIALNPFLTAQPRTVLNPDAQDIARMSLGQRLGYLVSHRMKVSRDQMQLFPDDALPGPIEKLSTVAVQGFGRFGPFGPHASNSVVRYDLAQDWGASIWLPVVLLGVIPYFKQGQKQRAAGEGPAGWAILLQAGLALIVVTAYLPLAWDRYYLSLQPGSALLGAGTIVAVAGRACQRFRHTEGS
jgi:4-amino-4-deoxy-L-arabinose transferase-like glycosyltransferase